MNFVPDALRYVLDLQGTLERDLRALEADGDPLAELVRREIVYRFGTPEQRRERAREAFRQRVTAVWTRDRERPFGLPGRIVYVDADGRAGFERPALPRQKRPRPSPRPKRRAPETFPFDGPCFEELHAPELVDRPLFSSAQRAAELELEFRAALESRR